SKTYKLNAGDGLFLEVTPKGSKRWRFRYTFKGKEQMLSMGLFPAIGLQEAREACEAARQTIRSGNNPSDDRKLARVTQSECSTPSNAFSFIASEWLLHQGHRAKATL